MRAVISELNPLLKALVSTVLGLLAFTALLHSGAGVEASLLAALIVAAILNIGALASLNGDLLPPTSPVPIGDNLT